MSWRPITLAAALCAALFFPGVAVAEDPPPEVESRAGTQAPAEVRGLSEPAQAGDPVAAARAHLADPRYHLDPAELTPIQTVVDGRDETVRFAQRHRGLPVFGAHYLVHFRTDGGQREVVGAGGRFLTELSVDPAPSVTGDTAARIARGLMGRSHGVTRDLTARTGELVVVPRGAGVLAWHVVLSGRAAGRPLLLDAYVDARSGRPLFTVDRLRYEGPVQGSGRTAHGRDVTLEAYQRADGAYELRDRSRAMWNGTTGEILTYDARGGDVFDYLGSGIPPGTEPARSATPVFGPEHTVSGAVDAHWGAGQVYEFYRGLGRDGLDGQGGTMYSVVNVTIEGEPFANAFWDGTKMVYGGGGEEYHSFAASLDVVGHEMTHGVIEHSANLVYLGQSGAINEGLADYFGNAVQVDTLGIPMSDPDASLLGEGLCRTLPPAECAGRDLDDARVAGKDYLGVTVTFDNGGVHLNSTIFSGALWDVREQLGGEKADKLAYKALTEYMTPLDDFTDGRRAVESAARALGWSARDRLTVALAFERHGIRPGWERTIRTDSRVLIDNITDFNAIPDVAGDRYVVSNSSPDGAAPSWILTGRLRGGRPVTLSEGDRWNYYPATDGRQAVWASYDTAGTSFQIHARPLDASSPPRLVYQAPDLVTELDVAGDVIAWQIFEQAGGETEIWIKRGDAAPVKVTAAAGVSGYQPSLNGGKLAYLRAWEEGGAFHTTPAVYDVATGTEVVVPEVPGTGGLPSDSVLPVMLSRYVVWTVDTNADGRYGIMRAAADGTGTTPVVPDDSDAPQPVWFHASDSRVAIGAWPEGDTLENATLPKIYQAPLTGGPLQRYSCNRGLQDYFSVGEGGTIAWLDGTAGETDLVTRDRAAVRC
ncbi:M4 family metallopeptidase [Nonomuraea gerenzanensis]|uniref:M4 family metallopeptidase n=1 Tax=Nonomuraea gerenzanensis TaxID=93944 RepID=UPI001CD9D79F|nr:M4 family metallopeptidase [Nonomuraea gerenzanensis]UBU17731.1 M4 family metallopeptidase [Nonomuraea gerenzanensis]